MTETLKNKLSSFISDGIIYGVASGILNTDEMVQQAKDLIDTAKKENVHRYLFDHRQVVFDFQKYDVFHLSHQLKDLGLTSDDKIAVLLPDDTSFDLWYSSFETSSVFHGNKVKLFNDEDAAVHWLKR